MIGKPFKRFPTSESYPSNREPRHHGKNRSKTFNNNNRANSSTSLPTSPTSTVKQIYPVKPEAVDFDCFQVHAYAQECWKNQKPELIQALIVFFKAIRKVITGVSAEEPMTIDTTINEKLNTYPKGDPSSPIYARETLPRANPNDHNFDETKWIRIYIAALPLSGVQIPLNSISFAALKTLNLDISTCRVNYARFRISETYESELEADTEKYIKKCRQQGQKPSEEHIEAMRFETRAKIYTERKKEQAMLWNFLDKLDELNKTEDVSDLSKPHIFTSWQLLTRNPAFVGNSFGHLLHSFAAFTLFEPPTTIDERSQIVVEAQTMLHKLTGDINAMQPTAEQLREYYKIIPIIKLQNTHLFCPVEVCQSYASLCQIDSDYVKLMGYVFEYEHDAIPRVGRIGKGFTPVIQKYPYQPIGILPPDDVGEIRATLNKLTASNMSAMIRLLSTFPFANVEATFIDTIERCPSFQFGALYMMAANELKLSTQLIKTVLMNRVESKHNDSAGIGLLGLALSMNLFDQPTCELIKHFMQVRNITNNIRDFFEGLSYMSETHPISFELKPILLEAAEGVFTQSDLPGYIRYNAKDVIDELKDEPTNSPRFKYFNNAQIYAKFTTPDDVNSM